MDLSKYLIVSDLDGTALVAGQPVPQANIDAINNFVDRGGRFSICTARGSKSASAFTKLINLKEPAIICNGTFIYDYATNTSLFKQTLPTYTSVIVKEFIKTFPNIGVEVVREPDVFIVNMTEATKRHFTNRNLSYIEKSIDEINDGISKVVFICNEGDRDVVDVYLSKLLKDEKEIKYLWTNDLLAEFTLASASKAVGLRKLCEELNIDINNTIAVGDYFNDIELLNTAKVKIVVDNAPQELKQMADMVVSSCLDGGLSEVLNNFEDILEKYFE